MTEVNVIQQRLGRKEKQAMLRKNKINFCQSTVSCNKKNDLAHSFDSSFSRLIHHHPKGKKSFTMSRSENSILIHKKRCRFNHIKPQLKISLQLHQNLTKEFTL
jgi:hypothetical protein